MKLRVLVAFWLAAWLGVVALLTIIAPRWVEFYARLGFELPYLSLHTFQLAEAVSSPLGLAMTAATLALGLLPLRLAPRWQAAIVAWFGGGVFVAGGVAFFVWLGLELPLHTILWDLGPPGPFQRSIESRASFQLGRVIRELPRWLCTFVVVGTLPWLVFAGDTFRRPRGSLAIEARRALVLCALPALVLGSFAFAAGHLGYEPESLVVSPALAAAGTVVVVVYGATLWFRLRRPAPDTITAPSPPT